MKRSTWEGQSLVYAYGVRRGAEVSEAALGQLRLAHELRNKMVEIELQLDEATAQAWLSYPEVARAAEAVEVARAELAEVLGSIQKFKQEERSRRVPGELQQQATEARAALRELKAAHKAAKEATYDRLKPTLVDLRDQRDRARKQTYADFVQDRGLYWPTYNDVVAHHDTAVRAVIALRRQGRAAQMRFHRWTGEGTLSLQVQRSAADPPRDPLTMADPNSRWRNMVQLPYVDPEQWATLTRVEQRRLARQGVVSVRIGSVPPNNSPVWWHLPVVWHRPLPTDSEVTGVQVTRRRVGGHYRLSVAVSIRHGSPEEVGPGRPAVALNLGWRSLGDGSYRVATWVASAPLDLDVPEELREWVRASATGATGEVVVPTSYTAVYDRLSGLRSLRDSRVNLIRAELVSWLETSPEAAEALEVTAAEVARWRSPARLAVLALRWRELAARVPLDRELGERLEAWRRQDRHLWEWESNESDQLVARRRDIYRKLSRLLALTVGLLVVESSDLAVIARVPRADQEDEAQAARARGQRAMVAPGVLRLSLVQSAAKAGVPVMHVDPAGITAVHAVCGTDLSERGVDFAASVRLWCPVCEQSFDQDYNACRHLLVRATQ